VERSKDWLFQAEGDLDHGRHDLDHGYFDWACFSAQQAAEKAVKAVFNALGSDAWGHSVSELLEVLAQRINVDQSLVDTAKELDKVYISARYPDALPSGSPRSQFTRAEAERMVSHGTAILNFCQGQIPGT